MSKKIKTCSECLNCRSRNDDALCMALDPLTGHPRSTTCHDERQDKQGCGTQGRLFEEKPPSPPKQIPLNEKEYIEKVIKREVPWDERVVSCAMLMKHKLCNMCKTKTCRVQQSQGTSNKGEIGIRLSDNDHEQAAMAAAYHERGSCARIIP